jgi:putative endonuclease
MSFHVYILECADKTYYTGSTNNLEKRLHQHNFLKSAAHYTKMRRPVILKYSEELESLGAARKRENELKKLERKQKELLWRKA